MLTEHLLTLSGFIYEISGRYYYMGKWICKPCTDADAAARKSPIRICISRKYGLTAILLWKYPIIQRRSAKI